MRLPFLRSKDEPTAERPGSSGGAAADPAVQAARTRARQRLAGALVLLAVGVIGFPMLFETQPRPLPADTPMELKRAEGSPPRATGTVASMRPLPPSLPPADAGTEAPPADARPPAPTASATPGLAAVDKAVDGRADKPVDKPPEKLEKPVERAVDKPVPKPADKPGDKAADKPVDKALPAPAAASAAPVGATAASAPAAPRFVVQAGAYTEATALRDARQKVEKLGLKTYTQVVDSDAGKRTRVRVGPFDTRQEADAVAARVKAAGLQAAVLAL